MFAQPWRTKIQWRVGDFDDDKTTNPSKTIVTVITSAPAKKRAAANDACLVIIYGDDMGRRIPLGTDPVVVGRSSKCEMQLDQDNVSRNHARISYDGRNHAISDLGSTNGTCVNDRFVDQATLKDGDQIKIGRTIFKFIDGDNVEGQYHEEIYRLMTVDGLTDVFNKRYFHEELDKEISRSRRYERSFALIMLDIDHFKHINDTYGHLAGDAILRQLAQVIRAKVRRDDSVARVGGEEFGILTPEVGLRGAARLAEKLRAMVEKKMFRFENTPLTLTISLGVAEWHGDMNEPEELIKQADEKLYEAKRAGRNCVKS